MSGITCITGVYMKFMQQEIPPIYLRNSLRKCPGMKHLLPAPKMTICAKMTFSRDFPL